MHILATEKRKIMKSYIQLTAAERQELYAKLSAQYREYKEKGLSLDLSRGKPNGSQLDISNGLLSVDLTSDFRSADGFDCRNCGKERFFREQSEDHATPHKEKALETTTGGRIMLNSEKAIFAMNDVDDDYLESAGEAAPSKAQSF